MAELARGPGPRQSPNRIYPILTGGGGFSHLAFLQELRISQLLGGRTCPRAQPLALGDPPPPLPYHDRGEFPVKIFCWGGAASLGSTYNLSKTSTPSNSLYPRSWTKVPLVLFFLYVCMLFISAPVIFEYIFDNSFSYRCEGGITPLGN